MLALLTSLGYYKDQSLNVEMQTIEYKYCYIVLAFSLFSDIPAADISEQDICTVINNTTGEEAVFRHFLFVVFYTR